MSAAKPLKVPQCLYCNETPYLMASLIGQGLTPGFTMTTVVKASYRLAPGAPLTPLVPQIQFRGDEWTGEDFQGGLHHGTDLVMCKPRTDLLLRAHCHAPGGRPVTACEAGFGVGEWRKTVRVSGERTWKVGMFTRRPGDAQPFTVMPLDWQHAYGGADYPDNPAGKGFAGDLLPNIEYPDRLLTGPRQKQPPAGFLPINRMWRKRLARMGSADGSYLAKRFPLPPEDFDWGYFNEAPDDQQLQHPLRGDEELWFANLHADAAHWTVRLPGTRLRCFVEDADEAGQPRVRESELRCDTLFANLVEGYVHLLWRGLLPVRSEDRAEVRKFYLVEEPLAGPQRTLAEHLAAMAVAQDLGGKMAATVAAEVEATKSKVAGILARYGLAMPALPGPDTKPGLSAAQLACFPFDPQGPLPPSAGPLAGELGRVDALRAEALEKFRALGREHGVDIAAIPPPAPLDLLARYRQALADNVAQITAQGGEVPAALSQQLAAASAPGGDPFGLAGMVAEFKKQGVDLAASANPLVKALATGGTAGLFAQAQLSPPAAADAPLPGAGPATASAAPAAAVATATAAATTAIATMAPSAAAPPPAAPAAEPPPRPRPAGAMDGRAAQAFLLKGGRCAGRVLYGADFSGLDLRGHDFTGAQLGRADFRGAQLAGAVFATTLLREADFRGADLGGAQFGFGDYTGADFGGAGLAKARFASAALVGCRFAGADLRGAEFADALLDGVDLAGADLGQARVTKGVWQKCVLSGARARASAWHEVLLSECRLDDADFSGAAVNDSVLMDCFAQRLRLVGAQLKGLRAFNGTDLQGALFNDARMQDTSWMYVTLDEADFSHGDLRQANFMFSSCVKARFAAADLRAAVLRHARLVGADFRRANLCQASFGRADLTSADLRESNCYETDFQDAFTTDAHFEGANLLRNNLRRG